MIKGKRGRRALYGLVGAVMVFTSVGGAVAKEIKPYKAPELRLVRGTEDYDLTEGITYDRGKYELMVEDTGNFDIEVLGKYTVEYSLTPLEDGVSAGNGGTVSSGGSVSGGSGSSGGGGGSGSSSAGGGTSVKETEAETGSADSQKPDQDNTGSGTEDKSDSDKNNGNSESGSTGTGSSEDKDSGDQNTSDKENSDKGNSDQGSSDKDTGDKDSSDTGSADQDSSDKDSDSNSSGSNDLAGSGTTAKAEGSFFSRLAARWIGTAYAAELPLNKKESHADKEDKADQENSRADQEAGKEQGTDSTAETKASESGSETAADGNLEETEDIIYFDRIVRVVPAEGDVNIEYDEPILEIPADTELFGVRIHRNVSVATSSNAERATASDADPKQESEVLWGDDDSDGITEEGVEYDLILKNPDILLADAFLTDKDGKKIKKAKITVKDDSDLKTAAHVVINEKGAPYIENLYLGTYMVELASADPETGEEIVCDREIQVIPNERILFDAPTLYIGTRNLSYDLTAGMMARDELNQEVKALYVVDETELLNAKEEVVATPSNAEAASEESPEKGDDAETELRLKKGLYHVVIGAKHPLTGEEFTVDRKVEVVDGCYIYAPVLEIPAGSTDYDLTSGAEVRNASDSVEKAVEGVKISVEDISDLYRGTEAAEETAADSTGETEAEKLAVKEGTYTVALSAIDPETGEKMTVLRQVRATRLAGLMGFQANYAPLGNTTYESGTIDGLAYVSGSKNGTLSGLLDSNWNNLFPGGGRPAGATMKDGGKPDVTVTLNKDLTDKSVLDLEKLPEAFTQGIDSSASIWVNGNGHDVLPKDFGPANPVVWTNKQLPVYEIPAMQVKLTNWHFPDVVTNFGNYDSTTFEANKDTYLDISDFSLYIWQGAYKLLEEWKYRKFSMGAGPTQGQRMTTIRIKSKNEEAKGNYDLKLMADSYYDNASWYDDTVSPSYVVDNPRNVEIKRGAGDWNMPISVKGAAGKIILDTNKKNLDLFYINKSNELEIKGGGHVRLKNVREVMLDSDERKLGYQVNNQLNVNKLEVKEDVVIHKSRNDGRSGTDMPVIAFNDENGTYNFNGKKVEFARSDDDGNPIFLIENDNIIESKKVSSLWLPDFSVYEVKINEKNKPQPFFSMGKKTNGSWNIFATMRTGGNIEVRNESGNKLDSFYTYKDALEYLKDKSRTGSYTIINNVEAVITEEDAIALAAFDNPNVSLTFESGVRKDGKDTTFNAYTRTNENGYRYRIYLETGSELVLPKDIKITFANCLFQLYRNVKDFTIVGNGGETHFYYRNMFVDINNQEIYPTVYGGTKDGTKTKNPAKIYLDLNKNVAEENVAEVYNYHKVSGLLHVQNLYNFDELSFGNNTAQDSIWGDVIVEKELIADKVAGRTPETGGYKGVVKLSRRGESSYQNTSEVIWLKGKDSEVKVGSLDITGGTIFHAPRAEYEEQGETIHRNDIRNKYILTLTSQKPIAITTNKLYLRPVDMESGKKLDYSKDDIALYLPNVPDDQRQENIVLGYTDNDQSHDKWDWGTVFENDFLVPFTQIKEKDGSLEKNYTIRYANETIVLRNDTTGILGNFYDLKSVLDDIKYQESKNEGSNYSISFDYGYHMTEADSIATKQAMTGITGPAKITWTQQISQWGTAISKSSITNERLYVEHDLHLFGKSNAFTGLNLAGKEQSGNQIGNIFANGKPVTVEPQGCTTNYNGGVALYGGSLEGPVENTDITLVTDRDDTVHTLNYVYGGGKQENTVTGAKVIKVLTNGTASAAKDGTMYVGNIRDFDELQVGNQDENVGTATLCVTEVLDSKFNPDANPDATDRTGKVVIQKGTLKFTGKYQSHIGKLEWGSANSCISIYKDESGITYPLLVDQGVELTNQNNNKLKVTTNGEERRPRDIVLKFSQQNKANASSYVDADTVKPMLLEADRFKTLIRFKTAAESNMLVTDHGIDGDPGSEHTDVGITTLTNHVATYTNDHNPDKMRNYVATGTKDKQVNGTWYSMPDYSSLADLYNIKYKNLALNDNQEPISIDGSSEAKQYFNRTGYGFVNDDGSFKKATKKVGGDGPVTYEEPESAVTIKLLKSIEPVPEIRGKWINELNQKVWDEMMFKKMGIELGLDRNSSLTIDGNGLDFGQWFSRNMRLPSMQLEFKNMKKNYITQGDASKFWSGEGSFEFWADNNDDYNTYSNNQPERTRFLKMTDVYSEFSNEKSLEMAEKQDSRNAIWVRAGIDVEVVAKEHGNLPFYMFRHDIHRTVTYTAYTDMYSPVRVEQGYKEVNLNLHGNKMFVSTIGVDWWNSGPSMANRNETDYRVNIDGVGDDGKPGILQFSKALCVNNPSGQMSSRIHAKEINLYSDVIVAKQRTSTANRIESILAAIYTDKINGFGSYIYASNANGIEPKDEEFFIGATNWDESTTFDPTDFKILSKADKDKMAPNENIWADEKGEWGLALYRRTDYEPGQPTGNYGHDFATGQTHPINVITYKKLPGEGLIEVKTEGWNASRTFSSYHEAFAAIDGDQDSTNKKYEITNNLAVNFEQEDADYLRDQMTDTGKTIIFSSGAEVPEKGLASFGSRYHIRLRTNTLVFPKNYDVEFKNIVLRYFENENENENENEIVMIKNGGSLTFGEGIELTDGRKIKVYGGSNLSWTDKNGTEHALDKSTSRDVAITIKSGEFSEIYGGGTKPQTADVIQKLMGLFGTDSNKVNTSITVDGGTIDHIYGGGVDGGTTSGDVTITINSGTITSGVVYGGGKNAAMRGDVTISVPDASKVKSVKSVYGGGEKAKVKGSSTVTVMSSQDVTDLATITADGSDESGTPANSVDGSKTITIKPAGNGPIQVTAGTVSGFSALNIGDGTGTSKDEVTSDANMTLTVTKRLDTWADESKTVARTDSTVTLYHSVLKVDIPAAADGTAGHIGNLSSTGLSKIYVHRNRPLVSDGNVTVGQAGNGSEIPIQLYPIETTQVGTEQKQVNLINERPMTFTNYVVDMEQKFTDVTSGLRVSAVASEYITGNPGTTKDLIFCVKSAAHKTNIWTEYTGEIEEITDTDTDGVPSVTGKTVNKTLHISYRDNDHRAKAGYIIRMPKKGADGNPLSEAEQQKYTQMNAGFMAAPGPDTLPRDAVILDFNYPQGQDAANTNIDITAVIPNADPKNYFYIMHVICADSEVTSSLLDLNAPVKVEEEQIGYDTASSEYTVKVKFQDKELVDTKKLPVSSIGGNSETHLTGGYLIDKQSGIKQWAWSYEDKTDKAKLHWMDVDAENKTPQDTTGLNNITPSTEMATKEAQEYSFRVPKASNAASVWLYVKDDHNNTAKMKIILKENLIDVAVPTKVSVIAIKKPNGGDTDLLAPVCYVENLGDTEVEASVSGFQSRDLMSKEGTETVLKLVNKNRTESFNPDEMALFLKPVANSTLPSKSELTETNVKSIDSTQESTWAKIGRMGSKDTQDSKKNFLDFTFDAGYNVENINETNDGRLTSIMSYHFTAVKSGN